MTWLIFIASGLACFRLTRLITDDKITSWLRSLVVRKAPRKAKAKLKYGIHCPFCMSGEISLVITGLESMMGFIPANEIWLWWPAIWGASVLFNQLFVTL